MFEKTLSDASARGTTLLAHCTVDPLAPSWPVQCMSLIGETGMAAFRGVLTREGFRAFSGGLLTPYVHPDSGSDAITDLKATDSLLTPGRGGFTNAELLPHTERSGVPVPPHLLVLGCLQPASSGGATVLIDGQAVFEDLARTHPDVLEVLAAERSVYFGGAAGHVGAVFERTPEGRWMIRLRLDELAHFSPRALPFLPLFQEVMERNSVLVRLTAGEGIVLDNTRWLHGRTPFTGARRMLRALGDPRPGFTLARGFFASWAAPGQRQENTA